MDISLTQLGLFLCSVYLSKKVEEGTTSSFLLWVRSFVFELGETLLNVIMEKDALLRGWMKFVN